MSQSDSRPDRTPLKPDYLRVFHDLPQAYMLFEAKPDYRIVEVNKAREALTGVSRESSIGKPLLEVFPDIEERPGQNDHGQLLRRIKQVIRTGEAVAFEPRRFDRKDAGGNVRAMYWQSTCVPLRDQDGTIAWLLAVARDITEEVEAQRRAISVENRLEAALSVGKVGSWLWDVRSNRIVLDKNLTGMLGLTRQTTEGGLTFEQYLESVHADDRARVKRAIRRSVQRLEPYDEEYRLVLPSGRNRWVLARGKLEEIDGKAMFPGVIVDITERRDLQAQIELAHKQDQLNRQAAKILQKRNEELENLARSKDEFVALASHQLRTPATAVKQYIGMVLQGYAGRITKIQRDMLENAFAGNERQIQIVNQILNAARVDTGRLALTLAPLDFRTLIQGIADDMKSEFEKRKHRFTLSLPKLPVIVSADLGYLRMAIENVLYNANVYTPDGGEISMKLQRIGKYAKLSVTDNGVGIKKADLNKLFVKFSRIHNPLSLQAGGSGIGLYLAAEIVRLHIGRIEVDSHIGKGATFAIFLPHVQ